ncbi:AraC family transcriptional regulator [Niastella yeongjuensis]|uniref:AraC family transcriptional regulator n=1 Tax=Niastella yeongjuensis TaxID=354355 RepID=A0A1V9E1G8_9BACT|nr:helix-turn-helix transcriptional regulator [Niastella yeongjuensis]OQP39956.1 AraC family transcriptional regulator [Niastella yeongjuensis]SEO11568.1 AraC-type DNA-binding protein [Niastella yeongjuensis]
MKHQIFNDQTKALFRMVYDEATLDRNFYGRDHKEKLLTIAWNRGADQNITIDKDVFIFPANTIHCLMVSETFQLEQPQNIVAWQFSREFYCIVDHDKEVSCVGFIFFGPPKKMFIQLAENDRRQVETILQMCQDEFENRDRIQGDMMQVLLKQLIIIVTRLAKQQYINKDSLPTDKFDIIRKYNILVETHYKNQHQVKFYAEQLFKSPKTLSNLFALYNHKSPLLIIQDRLLMEAKRLLYYTDKTAKEIGYDLGFEDAAHFSRFFKSRSGQSPTEFKKINFTRS